MEKKVVTELSKMVVREEIDENSTVYIDAGDGGSDLVYRVESGGLVDASTGKKSDVLIHIANGTKRSDAAQAVKKMRIEEIDGDEEMVED